MNTRYSVRPWWLVREDGGSGSYVVTVNVVTDRDTESERPAFESTILGLEDRIAGGGSTAGEAETVAMQLLHDMLEHSIVRGNFEDAFRGARGLTARRTAVAYKDMVDMLRELGATQKGKPGPAASNNAWRAEPQTAEAAEVCA